MTLGDCVTDADTAAEYPEVNNHLNAVNTDCVAPLALLAEDNMN
jgi:hypothetical protein